MLEFARNIRDRYDFQAKEIDFGGGFGIKYTESDKPLLIQDYMNVLVNAVKTSCENTISQFQRY